MKLHRIEYEIKNTEDSQTNNNMLMVSLYLVLLAFFILLNSIALTDQQKAKDALKSVNSSFTTDKKTGKILLRTPKPISQQVLIQKYTTDLKILAQNAFPIQQQDIVQEGNNLFITLPASDLFVEGHELIRQDKRAFLKRLSDSLNQDLQGARVHVQMVMSSRDYLGDKASPDYEQSLLRLGVLARYLMAGHVSPDRIKTGMTPGKQQTLTFRFLIYANSSNTAQ